jgi:Flp pilus assembly protein TadB
MRHNKPHWFTRLLKLAAIAFCVLCVRNALVDSLVWIFLMLPVLLPWLVFRKRDAKAEQNRRKGR